jgi:pyruvate/2-oxoglutarate dehydrogenase complex dihydrolipoamide dehydrogenase (E3) component
MKNEYDIIVVGAGSAGLAVSLFMAKTGLKTLLVDKTDKDIGGDCLNYGCVPSKALIHVSRILHHAKEAGKFGLQISGTADLLRATEYVKSKQGIIRKRENAGFLRHQGLDVVLGQASFHDNHAVKVNDNVYKAKKIVLATGSRPAPLRTPGIEKVKQYNNENLFDIADLPKRLLVVGGGPIGVEMGQAMHRLGSEVTIIDRGTNILPHDDAAVTRVLLAKLQEEGVRFIPGAKITEFTTANNAVINKDNGEILQQSFDAVLVAIGRTFELSTLELHKAGVQAKENKIVVNKYLETTNKDVLVCGDVAGDLYFSHAAEQHARLILNNLFSPFKKKLDNSQMSWVTFTDPEVATFGLQEDFLKRGNYRYERLEMDFSDDDRAIIDDTGYGKLILFLSKGSVLRKTKILGGSMVAPGAGELIQELVLANTQQLSINSIFNKIYPYPVASRVNQFIVVKHKERQLTERTKKTLRFVYKLFN